MIQPMKPRVKRTCKECNEVFQVLPSSKHLFCSKPCSCRYTAKHRAKLSEEQKAKLFWNKVESVRE